jgi:hypothetical protein
MLITELPKYRNGKSAKYGLNPKKPDQPDLTKLNEINPNKQR